MLAIVMSNSKKLVEAVPRLSGVIHNGTNIRIFNYVRLAIALCQRFSGPFIGYSWKAGHLQRVCISLVVASL